MQHVAFAPGKGGDDHFIGRARAGKEMLRVEIAIQQLDVQQGTREGCRTGGRSAGGPDRSGRATTLSLAAVFGLASGMRN